MRQLSYNTDVDIRTCSYVHIHVHIHTHSRMYVGRQVEFRGIGGKVIGKLYILVDR